MAFHAVPGYCRGTATGPCTCPEFDFADEDVASPSLLSPCETCDHAVGVHLPPLHLSPVEAMTLKSRGEPALEHCKAPECACPVFASAVGSACGLCSHKLGWHRWKDTSSAPPLSPSYPTSVPPYSPAESSSNSGTSSTVGTSSFGSNPFAYFPQPPQTVPTPFALQAGLQQLQHVPSASSQASSSSSKLFPIIYPEGHYPYPAPSAPPAVMERDPSLRPLHPTDDAVELLRPGRHVDKGKGVARTESPARPLLQVDTGAEVFPPPPPMIYSPRGVAGDRRSTQSSVTIKTITTVGTSGSGETESEYDEEDGYESSRAGDDGDDDDGVDLATLDLEGSGPTTATFSSRFEDPTTPDQVYQREEEPPAADNANERLDPRFYGDQPAQTSPAKRTLSGDEARGKVWRGQTNDGPSPSGAGLSPIPDSGATSPPLSSSPPPPTRSHSIRHALFRSNRRNSQGSTAVLSPSTESESSTTNVLPPSRSRRNGSMSNGQSGRIGRHGSVDAGERGGPPVASTSGSLVTEADVSRVNSNRSQNSIDPSPRDYDSKNLSLQISPALDAGRFSPGQVFKMTLSLGPKVSLSTFEKIEIRLTGNGSFNGEPPDNHDFLVLHNSILPLGPGVEEVGRGQRTFSWNMQLPTRQTCSCRDDPRTIPSSFNHLHFRIAYKVELVAKKSGRFGTSEKITEMLAVNAPFEELRLDPMVNPRASPIVEGTDGIWNTSTSNREIAVEGQSTRIVATELAWQLVASPAGSQVVRIPYRVSLIFDPTSRSDYLSPGALAKLEADLSLTLSRRVTFTPSLVKGHAKSVKDEELPALKVAVVERERTAPEIIVNERGGAIWRYGGVLEAARNEGRSLSTCNVHVRYVLTARALPSCGLDRAIEVQARGLNLELIPPPTSTLPALAITTSGPSTPSNLSTSPIVSSPYSTYQPNGSTSPSFSSAFARFTRPGSAHTSSDDSNNSLRAGQMQLVLPEDFEELGSRSDGQERENGAGGAPPPFDDFVGQELLLDEVVQH